MLYDLIPNMPEQRLRPLIEEFEEMLGGHAVRGNSAMPKT